jgi:hypothetical protein
MYLKKLRRKKEDSSEEVAQTSRTIAETISVPQSVMYEAHPLASVSGLFADDPLWSEYLEAIKQIREEDDALENQVE